MVQDSNQSFRIVNFRRYWYFKTRQWTNFDKRKCHSQKILASPGYLHFEANAPVFANEMHANTVQTNHSFKQFTKRCKPWAYSSDTNDEHMRVGSFRIRHIDYRYLAVLRFRSDLDLFAGSWLSIFILDLEQIRNTTITFFFQEWP